MDTEFPQFGPFQSSGAQVRVDSSASGSITRCIESAAPGTTIIIPQGEYRESLVIDKEVTIQGEGEVILTASPGKDTIALSAPSCVIRGLQIKPGISQSASPVNFLKGSALFESCTITSDYMPPIVVHQEGNLYFASCAITSDEAAIMYVNNKVNVEFSGCVISSPHTVGIIANGSSRVRLLNNTNVTKCGDSGLIFMDLASVYMDGCVVSENGGDAIELNTRATTNRIMNSAIGNHDNGTAVNCNGAGSLKIENCALSNCAMGLFATNGFQVEGVQCEIHDITKSALVCATLNAKISLLGGRLYGQCLIGIISDRAGTVACDRVKIDQIQTTGASVTGGSTLTFMQCAFEGIEQAAIEAHDSATLQVSGCQFATIKQIGILIQNDVKGYVKETDIMNCEVVGVHYVDNQAEFQFEQCRFTRCNGTGLNVKNTKVTFTNCEFTENGASGIEARGPDTKPTFVGCTFAYNENGATMSEGCGPLFESCRFDNNRVAGVVLEQTSGLAFEGCEFANNNEMGIYASEAAEARFNKATIAQNGAIGAQIQTEDTDVHFNECVFYEMQQGGAVVVDDNGNASFTKCQLYRNGGAHIAFQNGGKGVITQCELYQSNAGIGVMISNSGYAKITASTFHDESQSAIVISSGGNCTCELCDISRCQVCGVYLLQGNSGTFTKNKVHDNATVGFIVMDGSPSILENEIYNHQNYAINIASNADPQVIGNIFHDNGVIDVNRE